jgi:hypothetical protein
MKRILAEPDRAVLLDYWAQRIDDDELRERLLPVHYGRPRSLHGARSNRSAALRVSAYCSGPAFVSVAPIRGCAMHHMLFYREAMAKHPRYERSSIGPGRRLIA